MHRAFKRIFRLTSVGLAIFLCALPPSAHARTLIRDAEIEHTLRTFADPLFITAGLTPSAIKIFIIQDNSINAFVAGGSNMFIHTGLILATRNPAMLVGVMAHETGHIAGGHLAQGAEKIQNAQMGTILSYVLGAAAIAAGSSDAGTAIITGGQEVSARAFLSYSRMNEQSADQAALSYLSKLRMSPSGLLDVLSMLKKQEDWRYGTFDPYALTHPLSKERIASIRRFLMNSDIPKDAVPPEYLPLYQRMIAKLSGFLQPPPQVLRRYPVSNHSIEARYARAVAYYRSAELDQSLKELDSLLKDEPEDPFFHELKGQILYENGRIEPALESYRKAASLLPDAPLILTALAQAEMSTNDPLRRQQAIDHLEKSSSIDPSDANTWRLLASAYGQSGQMGKSSLALAEEASLKNDPEAALQQARLALKELKSGSPAHLRANDLVMLSQKQIEENEEFGKFGK